MVLTCSDYTLKCFFNIQRSRVSCVTACESVQFVDFWIISLHDCKLHGFRGREDLVFFSFCVFPSLPCALNKLPSCLGVRRGHQRQQHLHPHPPHDGGGEGVRDHRERWVCRGLRCHILQPEGFLVEVLPELRMAPGAVLPWSCPVEGLWGKGARRKICWTVHGRGSLSCLVRVQGEEQGTCP